MNDDLISVVIPVYNVENYLEECLSGVLSQTYENLEILLVDDGSSDSSYVVADKFRRRDGRIQLLSRPHGGLSAARNTGLCQASGRFVYFMDSDDRIIPGALETLHSAAAANRADLVQGAYCIGKMPADCRCLSQKAGKGRALLCELLETERYIPQVWSLLLRHSFLKKHGLRFEPGLIHEDECFTPQCYWLASRAVKLDYPFYNYRKRPDSIMGRSSPERSLPHWLRLTCELAEFMRKYPASWQEDRRCCVRLFEYLSMRGALLAEPLSPLNVPEADDLPAEYLPVLGFFLGHCNGSRRVRNSASFRLGRLLLSGPGKIYRSVCGSAK